MAVTLLVLTAIRGQEQQVAERTEVAEGVWCKECEFFETPDPDGDKCIACGCLWSVHADAVVVTTH